MTSKHIRRLFAPSLLLLICTYIAKADIVLFNNLPPTATNIDGDNVTTTTWSANLFATDNNSYQLTTVTLLMSITTQTGIPEVDIYTDNSNKPGIPVGSPLVPNQTSYSTGDAFANATFTASGITLNPNSNYWVVLHPLSGQFDWGFTTGADSGNGNGVSFQVAGFHPEWNFSPNSGVTWETAITVEPYQMQVDATTATSAVPEPSSLLLLGTGLLGAVGAVRRKLLG